MLYLERIDGGQTSRLGLDLRAGGVVAELSLNGENMVNAFDVGRQVQLSLYDGDEPGGDLCAGCSGSWPWNPVQGGDRHGHGSAVLMWGRTDSTLWVLSRPNHWFPDNRGGGPAAPVVSDMMYQVSVSVPRAERGAFLVRYRATHLGRDTHGAAWQEVPAVYVNGDLDTFTYYEGTSPWTEGAVTRGAVRDIGDAAWAVTPYSIPERWAAFVNDRGVGVTVYVPGAYPYALATRIRDPQSIRGSAGWNTQYLQPKAYFGVAPLEVLDASVYLFAGTPDEARRSVYRLNREGGVRDISEPYVVLDPPGAQPVSGVVTISGAAMDNVAVRAVDVLVDDAPAGRARTGLPAPAFASEFPDAAGSAGFEYSLDTRNYPDGDRKVSVRVTDAAGLLTVRTIRLRVDN
ncbi:MAG TPA: hypothetical protein VF665_15620 [Longimicrobium sp.]|jgi:hypothetical protein